MLASFANQASLALDRTQALFDREELAVISDRERVARALLDLVIQRLFAPGLRLQAIESDAFRPEISAWIGRLDDGAGLPRVIRESGLRNARCRERRLGGVFEITSRESHGTSLVWRVPLS
ncbi:MAG: hypothetical protein ACR2KG_09860 [Nocardioidaceae bacterium]